MSELDKIKEKAKELKRIAQRDYENHNNIAEEIKKNLNTFDLFYIEKIREIERLKIKANVYLEKIKTLEELGF